jgi:hypothetical protein
MPEPMVLATPEMITPGDSEFWTSPDMYDSIRHHPAFRISETARAFYGMSPGWLRKHVKVGYEWDGQLWQPPRTATNDMYFRLFDIELFAHILAEEHVISGQHLKLTVTIVKSVAQLNHFIV